MISFDYNMAMDDKKFLLMPRSLGLWQSVATLVASAAGIWILFSPVEAVSWSGIAGLTGYALGQAAPLIIISFMGLRLLRTLPQGHTLPQWAHSRYGRVMRVTTLLICIFYMATFLTAELTAIGKAAGLLTNIPDWMAVATIALITWGYTNRGGFKMVVWTDIIQFAVMVPLLIIIFIITMTTAITAPEPFWGRIMTEEPQLLSVSHLPGIEFGMTLVIAIAAAQVFNQGLWQRAYSCRNEKTMSQAFFIAGIIMIPLIFITGFLGLSARDAGLGLEDPEVGIFELMINNSPLWLTISFAVAALMLVMSSMDTMLNALSGLVVEELSLHKKSNSNNNDFTIKITQARIATSVFALITALIATQGYSVLYLFLLADLICAGTAFPLFFGLYSKRLSQTGALSSAILGISCGILFMLRPDFTPLINNPLGSSWLLSFAAAAITSCIATLIFAYLFSSSNKLIGVIAKHSANSTPE